MMKIGRYQLYTINTGFFKLDGGAMFGIIPKPLWEKTNPPDELNRIKMAARSLLLTNGNRKILVDTGLGNKWNEKSRKIYDINSEFTLAGELQKLNIKPDEITDVILTHLHFDHTGGSTIDDNGKIVPAFPNAKYYVQKKNFAWAMNPTERDRGSYLKENFMPLYEAGILNFIDGEEKFDDEIEFIVINGHTFAQQLVKISDASNTFLFCCDLFPTTSHISLPYIMGYDLQPLVTLQEKKRILQKTVDENWKLLFEHDAETIYATITAADKGYKIDAKFNSL